MTDTNISLPPACPVCAGTTTLKEVRHSSRPEGYMHFFKCGACAAEYPRLLDAAATKAFGVESARAAKRT